MRFHFLGDRSLRFFLGCAAVLFASTALANPWRGFTQKYCADCHSGGDPESGFSIDELLEHEVQSAEGNLSEQLVARWQQVIRRIESNEMPPQDSEQPEAKESAQVLKLLKQHLTSADRKRQLAVGRGVLRRLNRVEFENTLSDLLHVPLHIRDRLPPDARGEGFDTVGEALNVSAVQMESYLEAIDVALDQATQLTGRPKRHRYRLDYRHTTGMMEEYRRSGPYLPMEDGLAMFAPDFVSHFNSLLDTYVVPHAGQYQVRVSAYAIRSDEPITLTVRMGGPGHHESDEQRRTLLGNVSVQPGDPQLFAFEESLERGQMFRIYPSSLRRMRFSGEKHFLKQDQYDGPAIVIQWVEVEGPIYESWPPPSHQRLYAGIPIVAIEDALPNRDPNEHLDEPPQRTAKPRLTKPEKPLSQGNVKRMIYDPTQSIGGEKIYPRTRVREPLRTTMRLQPDDPKADCERLLLSFVKAAFREPVGHTRIKPTIDLVHHWLDEGADFEQAMRVGYKAILVSPDFLYHQARHAVPPTSPLHKIVAPQKSVQASSLNPNQLAERLAYFLWNSLPDDNLRDLARTGQLDSPEELRRQVDRMLADPKSERFIANFLDQWLDLRQIDFTSPDSALYPEFDPLLKWSMVEESRAFFRELIRENLPVTHVVDSDFVMLNDRLAKHYGLDGVRGAHFRKVSLPADSVRGGFLTQASVLKVTANGTTTSPVVRGVWVLDRIMGTPPAPPPPGIPAIEPDIRGAVTVREQLNQHRSVESCARCHNKIDPPGVALESFDVIGGYRDQYRVIVRNDTKRKAPHSPDRAPPILYKDGPEVDAADVLGDGRAFEDIRDFKRLLIEDPDAIARTVIEKLLVYAAGAPLSIADHDELDRLIERSRPFNHGLRSLIHCVVQSRIFQEK